MGDKTYEWGRTGRLRMQREYLGLTVNEMSDRLGMSRRSYQRMETGQAAIPSTLWDTIAALTTEFDTAVERLLASVRELEEPMVIDMTDDMTSWNRAVIARALHSEPDRLDVKVPDDYDAMKEMRG